MITKINSGIVLRFARGYELCRKCDGEGVYASGNKIIDCWCMELVRLAKRSDEMEIDIDSLKREMDSKEHCIRRLNERIKKLKKRLKEKNKIKKVFKRA